MGSTDVLLCYPPFPKQLSFVVVRYFSSECFIILLCNCDIPVTSSTFPSYISGVHQFGQIFAKVTDLKKKNPTIEVVTFHIRGWCMLDVFGMCAQARPQFILLSEKSFGGMESEPMLTPREKSLLSEKSSSEGDWTHNDA